MADKEVRETHVHTGGDRGITAAVTAIIVAAVGSAMSTITPFLGHEAFGPADIQAMSLALEHVNSGHAKSLWSRYVPNSGEFLPTFQSAFPKSAFPGSNPGAPADQ